MTKLITRAIFFYKALKAVAKGEAIIFIDRGDRVDGLIGSEVRPNLTKFFQQKLKEAT